MKFGLRSGQAWAADAGGGLTSVEYVSFPYHVGCRRKRLFCKGFHCSINTRWQQLPTFGSPGRWRTRNKISPSCSKDLGWILAKTFIPLRNPGPSCWGRLWCLLLENGLSTSLSKAGREISEGHKCSHIFCHLPGTEGRVDLRVLVTPLMFTSLVR